MNQLDKTRFRIAKTVRQLRHERKWTQAELAARLGMSQSRLSEIERGDGSFTAEQLLVIMKLFNVTATRFAPATRPDDHAALQNALARLGAAHLQESETVLPSAALEDVNTVVREVLIGASPRLVAALGPVVVRNIDRLNLRGVDTRLADAGLERRLSWFAESVLDAIRRELDRSPPRSAAKQYQRAALQLASFLQSSISHQRWSNVSPGELVPDLLDPTIRSNQTLRQVTAERSPIAHRWGIVTALQPEDFTRALRAVYGTG